MFLLCTHRAFLQPSWVLLTWNEPSLLPGHSTHQAVLSKSPGEGHLSELLKEAMGRARQTPLPSGPLYACQWRPAWTSLGIADWVVPPEQKWLKLPPLRECVLPTQRVWTQSQHSLWLVFWKMILGSIKAKTPFRKLWKPIFHTKTSLPNITAVMVEVSGYTFWSLDISFKAILISGV